MPLTASFAPSHCDAATSVKKSGANTATNPQRARRLRIRQLDSPLAGKLGWMTVQTAAISTTAHP